MSVVDASGIAKRCLEARNSTGKKTLKHRENSDNAEAFNSFDHSVQIRCPSGNLTFYDISKLAANTYI